MKEDPQIRENTVIKNIMQLLTEMPALIEQAIAENKDVLKKVGNSEMQGVFIAGYKLGANSVTQSLEKILAKSIQKL